MNHHGERPAYIDKSQNSKNRLGELQTTGLNSLDQIDRSFGLGLPALPFEVGQLPFMRGDLSAVLLVKLVDRVDLTRAILTGRRRRHLQS